MYGIPERGTYHRMSQGGADFLGNKAALLRDIIKGITCVKFFLYNSSGRYAAAKARVHFTSRSFVTKCHNSKFVIFQAKGLNVLKYYNFLWVQRWHNCSPAASFVNCVMTLYLLQVHLQTFLSLPITQKMSNFELTLLTQMSEIFPSTNRRAIPYCTYS